MSLADLAGETATLRQGTLWELGLDGAPARPPTPIAVTPVQIGLPLAWPTAPGDDEFLVSPSNEQAVALLDRWCDWPVRTALLTGPRKSGRSLLARIWAAKTKGALIDGAEAVPEAQLFHAWNEAQAGGRALLLVADAAPPVWAVKLPDLRSRLAASPVAAIRAPDDALMRGLFERQFLRRGVDARAEVLDWLVARIERGYVTVMRAVDVLEQASLGAHRRLSIPLARATLQTAKLIAEDR